MDIEIIDLLPKKSLLLRLRFGNGGALAINEYTGKWRGEDRVTVSIK